MSQAPANETAKARHAYTVYESMGAQRSTAKVGQALGKSKDLIDRWCAAHGWVKRAAAYDAEQDAQAAAEEAEERNKARRQRLQVARAARGKGVEALAALTPAQLAHLPSAMVRLLEYADSTERKDLGEPDQRVEVAGPDGRDITVRVIYDDSGNSSPAGGAGSSGD